MIEPRRPRSWLIDQLTENEPADEARLKVQVSSLARTPPPPCVKTEPIDAAPRLVLEAEPSVLEGAATRRLTRVLAVRKDVEQLEIEHTHLKWQVEEDRNTLLERACHVTQKTDLGRELKEYLEKHEYLFVLGNRIQGTRSQYERALTELLNKLLLPGYYSFSSS